jgi:hypothetical protein
VALAEAKFYTAISLARLLGADPSTGTSVPTFALPPSNPTPAQAWPPLQQQCYFIMDKTTFGQDEVDAHGCFWHAHSGCPRWSTPKSNISYWAPKLAGNQLRDTKNIATLQALGFRPLIIWECISDNKPALRKALREFFGNL